MPYHEDFEFYNALDRLPPPVPQGPGTGENALDAAGPYGGVGRYMQERARRASGEPESAISGFARREAREALWHMGFNREPDPPKPSFPSREDLTREAMDLVTRFGWSPLKVRGMVGIGRGRPPSYQYGQPDVPGIPARTGLPSPPIARPGLPRSAPPRGPGLPSLFRGPEPERPVSKLPQIGSGPAPKRIEWNHSELGGIETWRTPDGTIGSGRYYTWEASSGELGGRRHGRSLSLKAGRMPARPEPLYKVGGTYDTKTKEFYIDSIGPTEAGIQHYGRWGGGGTVPPDIRHARGSYDRMQEVMGGRFKSAPLLSFIKAIKTQFPDVKWLSGDRITGIPGARRQYIGKGRPTEADKSEIANLGRGFPYAPSATNKKLIRRGLLRQKPVSHGDDLHARRIPEAWFEGEDPGDEYIKEFWDKAQGDTSLARSLRRRLDEDVNPYVHLDPWAREQEYPEPDETF
jgi:hypothetical protein